MAHEIGHITARHAAQRAEFEKTTALFSHVNSQLLEQRQAQDEVEARSKLAIARFSREQEFAADQIGIKTIGRVGYDPYGAARFLTALGEWSALSSSVSGGGSANRPDMMATHPSTPERVAQATEAARQFGPPGTGETGRNAYLAAIDGLAFGEDPSPGHSAGKCLHSPKTRFCLHGPRRLHARQSVGGADRRGRNGRRGATPRQHSDPGVDACHQRHRFGLDRRCQDDIDRIQEDRWPGSSHRGRAGRTMELPPRSRAP